MHTQPSTASHIYLTEHKMENCGVEHNTESLSKGVDYQAYAIAVIVVQYIPNII